MKVAVGVIFKEASTQYTEDASALTALIVLCNRNAVSMRRDPPS